jgi:hypothetical protein
MNEYSSYSLMDRNRSKRIGMKSHFSIRSEFEWVQPDAGFGQAQLQHPTFTEDSNLSSALPVKQPLFNKAGPTSIRNPFSDVIQMPRPILGGTARLHTVFRAYCRGPHTAHCVSEFV